MTDDAAGSREEHQAETDACAQIARCHRHQHPADYGVPYVANAQPTVEEQIAIAEMIVDRGPADTTP